MKFKRYNMDTFSQLHSCFSILVIIFYSMVYLVLNSSTVSGTPTVKPYDKFDVEKDVLTIHEILRKENNFTPDVDKMIRMVCHRSNKQRIEMKELFRKKYNEDIAEYCAKSVKDAGFLPDLLRSCFRNEMETYVYDLHDDIISSWRRASNGNSIVEILLSVPPEKKQEFLKLYQEAFTATVLGDLQGNYSDDFLNLVTEMVNRNRRPDIQCDKIDWGLAKKEAQILHNGRKDWEDKRCELDRILMETPFQQLNATFIEYKNTYGKELDQVMKKHMNSDKRVYYQAMVFSVKNKIDYYARRLEKATEGWGITHRVVNRIITLHSETDLVEIAAAFQSNTGDSLIDVVSTDTTHYNEMLLGCLAGKQFPQD